MESYTHGLTERLVGRVEKAAMVGNQIVGWMNEEVVSGRVGKDVVLRSSSPLDMSQRLCMARNHGFRSRLASEELSSYRGVTLG